LAEDADAAVGNQLPAEEDFEAKTDHKELVQAVRAAVNELPTEQRELVCMHDLEGSSLVAAG
jgi:DNA-directed RNA polymerase specialized sigma24 family protein